MKKIFNNNFLQDFFQKNITTRQELVETIKFAAKNGIFDLDSLPLIEAAIQFGDMRAKDIVLPRHEVDVLDLNASTDKIITTIKETGHSRFPVVNGSFNDVIGVFHSKDIVHYLIDPEHFTLHDYCRKAFFVPDLKPLDSLLYEMRLKQIHLAIVVDEFTNVVGIVTLEMIIEQIVGEIDDEYDSADEEHAIIELEPGTYRTKGYCGLEMFNEKTELGWSDSKVETVGGYLTKMIGRIPSAGEEFTIDNHKIIVISADSRKINSVLVSAN